MSTTVSTQTPGSLNPTRQHLDELETLLKRMLDLPVNQLAEADEDEDADDEPAAPPPAMIPSGETPPVSYMVVETASPRPIPPASGFESRPSLPAPRLVPVTAPAKPPVEEAPVPPAPVAAAEPDASPAEMPAADAASAEAEVWVPLRSTWQPSAQTWQPLADSWQHANGAAPAPAAMPAAMPHPKLDVMPLIPPTTPVPPAPVPPRLSLTAEDAPVSVSPVLLPLVWFNQGFDACLAPLGASGRWLCGPRARQVLGAVGLLGLAAAAAVIVSAGMGWSW